MVNAQSFTGFPEAGLQFLADLAKNNNREWFEANKRVYKTQLEAPALELIAVLGPKLKAISEGIIYDPRASGSLTRIYRDVRFSPDKTPYNTHIDLLFWEGVGKKSENPIFGLRFEAGGGGLLTGMYGFPPPMVKVYREAVDDDRLGAELVEALTAVRSADDYEIGREHYKRVPAGYAPDHPRADLLRYNGLYAIYSGITPEIVTSTALVDVCFEQCRKTAPIFKWLVKIMRG